MLKEGYENNDPNKYYQAGTNVLINLVFFGVGNRIGKSKSFNSQDKSILQPTFGGMGELSEEMAKPIIDRVVPPKRK